MNTMSIIENLAKMIGDDKVEELGVFVGKSIKAKVDEAVASTETTIDDTKGIAFLNGVAKGVLGE